MKLRMHGMYGVIHKQKEATCPICKRVCPAHETDEQVLARIRAPDYVECLGCNGRAENIRKKEERSTLNSLVKAGCETYCHDCKQLRLWLRSEKPERCGNCHSTNIEIDKLGSKRLTELRFGKLSGPVDGTDNRVD